MTGNVHKSRIALRDLDKIADYIQRKGRPKQAIRFLKAAESTFHRLVTVPNFGTAYEPAKPRFAGLRYCPVGRYKSYVVFYRPTPDGIEVLRVLHSSRDLEDLLTEDDDNFPEND